MGRIYIHGRREKKKKREEKHVFLIDIYIYISYNFFRKKKERKRGKRKVSPTPSLSLLLFLLSPTLFLLFLTSPQVLSLVLPRCSRSRTYSPPRRLYICSERKKDSFRYIYMYLIHICFSSYIFPIRFSLPYS